PHRDLVLELGRAENPGEIPAFEADRAALAFGDANRRVPQHLSDLALEIAHARLAGVARDDRAQHVVADLDLARLQPVRLPLPVHQIAPRDLELLLGRIARETDHLHAVAQRAGYSGVTCCRA